VLIRSDGSYGHLRQSLKTFLFCQSSVGPKRSVDPFKLRFRNPLTYLLTQNLFVMLDPEAKLKKAKYTTRKLEMLDSGSLSTEQNFRD